MPKKFTARKSKSGHKVLNKKKEDDNCLYYEQQNEINNIYNENNYANIQNPNNENFYKLTKEIEYGKALQILHDELYSFKLIDGE